MHRASTRRGRGVHTPLPEFSTFCRCRGPYLVSSPTRAVQSPHMPICSWDVRERMVISRSLVISRATGTGGGADVLDRPRTTPGEPKTRRRRGRPSIYKVLLHNDDYNKREYVVQVLLKHVEGYTVRCRRRVEFEFDSLSLNPHVARTVSHV